LPKGNRLPEVLRTHFARMNSTPLSRRDFIATITAASALMPFAARAANTTSATAWPIGCFNRPWVKWSYDEALDSIKAAGYKWTGLLSPTPARGDIFTSASATPEYLATLKQKIAARGLKVNMAALRVKNDLALADAIADTRKQIENARIVGVEYALTFGESRPERYEQYFKVMADAAAFAQERGIKLVMKPHGGGSGSSKEIATAIKAVGHPNFKIWYDAGNIIFYTGKDPVAELDPIAEHVTGFCAKDCGAQRGEVFIQFGTGKVDFAGVFKKLKAAGFNGPIMVECCKLGATAQETTENARANRLYLEKVLASV
jgi:sugar phosphate isomerase/epimerase